MSVDLELLELVRTELFSAPQVSSAPRHASRRDFNPAQAEFNRVAGILAGSRTKFVTTIEINREPVKKNRAAARVAFGIINPTETLHYRADGRIIVPYLRHFEWNDAMYTSPDSRVAVEGMFNARTAGLNLLDAEPRYPSNFSPILRRRVKALNIVVGNSRAKDILGYFLWEQGVPSENLDQEVQNWIDTLETTDYK